VNQDCAPGTTCVQDGVRRKTISGVLCLLPGSILWNIRSRAMVYGLKFVFEFEGENQTYITPVYRFDN